jgi:O-antigen ligase
VAIVLFLPLVVPPLWWRGSRAAAILVALLAFAAIWTSISWSAKLASLAILLAWPLSRLAPRLIHVGAGAGMLGAFILAPLYVGQINALLPASIHDAVGYGSLTIRGEIWGEYAALVPERPILGFGLEAGNIIPATPYVAHLTEAQIHLLNFGHPHNAAVQIWFELGLVGVVLGALLLFVLFRAMARLDDRQLSMASVTSLAVFTVAFVSHGAWQAWWLTLVALVAGLFLLQRREAERPRT